MLLKNTHIHTDASCTMRRQRFVYQVGVAEVKTQELFP